MMLNIETIDAIKLTLARQKLVNYAKYVKPKLKLKKFHRDYYHILDLFAHGFIKRLIITMAPQHGKSEGSSRLLPSYVFGIDPNKKIFIGSYSAGLAQDFNRDCQRIMTTRAYHELFPETQLNSSNVVTLSSSYLRNSNVFEIVNAEGSLRVAGRKGGISGRTVDIAILDDLYKDYEEGNSPIIREAAWNWYVSAVKTRLHNNSQVLIVFTRWNEDDIIGRLEKTEKVVTITSLDQLKDVPEDAWVKINFEAIKVSEPTELDPREKGEALWPEMHDLQGLLAQQALDSFQFDCLYQGNPASKEGQLYGIFQTYDSLPRIIVKRGNYTDTADEGDDYLCSICYIKASGDKNVYVTDVLYTQEPMEKTEGYMATMIERNDTRDTLVESNNGGKGFARAVRSKCPKRTIRWFHQGGNKESRILTYSSTVVNNIIFPSDWAIRWPEFYKHVTTYKRMFAANKYNDAEDCLTGIAEKEILPAKSKGIKRKN
jgi:predicted phage terminase large subunit-like protein